MFYRPESPDITHLELPAFIIDKHSRVIRLLWIHLPPYKCVYIYIHIYIYIVCVCVCVIYVLIGYYLFITNNSNHVINTHVEVTACMVYSDPVMTKHKGL